MQQQLLLAMIVCGVFLGVQAAQAQVDPITMTRYYYCAKAHINQGYGYSTAYLDAVCRSFAQNPLLPVDPYMMLARQDNNPKPCSRARRNHNNYSFYDSDDSYRVNHSYHDHYDDKYHYSFHYSH